MSGEVVMSSQLAKRYFSVTEYYRMAEAGILTEADRVELIEGEIVKMSPIGRRHAACVGRLTELLGQLLSSTAIVWVQNPIQLDEYSEPQPDVTLLKRRDDFYEKADALPADVLLVIEVADTTVLSDRNVKVPLYARAGIPEVWLIDLQQDVIEIYAHAANGIYQVQRQARRGEQLTAEMWPQLTLAVDAVLG
jgi:Uma2 family endonuclease